MFPSDNGAPMNERRRIHRPSEQGGITILTVLGLLVLLTVMVFSLGKSSIRELTVSGTVWQAAKASEAAEAGLDWFVLWTNRDNQGSATARDRDKLSTAFQQINISGSWLSSPYLLNPSTTWDRALMLRSTEQSADSDMVLSNTGVDYLQASTGNTTVQSFDLMCRYLGAPFTTEISGTVGGTGNTAGQTTQAKGLSSNLYQVQSRGKASVPTGGNSYIRYMTNREMFVTIVP
jgi:hypothetical protein